MAINRYKSLNQGLPGTCSPFKLNQLSDGDMVQWNSADYEWKIKAASETVDLTANYTWTGTHTFESDISLDNNVFITGDIVAGTAYDLIGVDASDDLVIGNSTIDTEINGLTTLIQHAGADRYTTTSLGADIVGEITQYNGSSQKVCEITSGKIELGNQSVADNAFIDFKTKGTGGDYDSRIIGLTGTGHATFSGYGHMDIVAAELRIKHPGSSSSDIVFTADGAGANTATWDDMTLTVYAPPAAPSTQFVGRGTGSSFNTIWYNSTPTTKAYVTDSGAFVGASFTVSDERRKRAIIDETNGKDVLKQIRAVSFIYNDDETNTRRSGFLAQQLLNLIPEAVTLMPAVPAHEMKGVMVPEVPETYVIDTMAILPTVINAIKELDDDNRQMKLRIRRLEQHLGL